MAQQMVTEKTLVNRLKRIEGQVRGLQRMIEEGRDCESILIQLAAVRSAIEGVGALVLNNYMKLCIHKETEAELNNSLSSLARSIAIWGRLHVGEGD